MSATALVLVVTAALLHAVWNLVTKQVKGGLTFFWLISLASAILYLPLVCYMLAKEHASYSRMVILFSVVSAVLHILYFVALQVGYRKADLSIIYPVARGAGPLMSVAGAMLLFHEHAGLLALAGVLLIASGVVVMTGFSVKKGTSVLTGVYYGVLTGAFIAAYTLWDKDAVVDHHVSAVFITFASMVLPLLVLLPYALRRRAEVAREVRVHWKQVGLVALFQPLSYLLVLVALKTTPIIYVAPVRELSIVFGVFFGVNLLKERDSAKRLVAACIILAGIVLLALG